MKIPTLVEINHVHIYSKNRQVAEQWYQNILGFTAVEKYKRWATKSGPLVLSNPEQSIHLAIFERECFTPNSSLAFGVTGGQFVKWKTYLEKTALLKDCKDHSLSFSLYFSDTDGNGLEITTEDYDFVKNKIRV